MEKIRPISDLRNKFTEISEQVNVNNDIIFLTKNIILTFSQEIVRYIDELRGFFPDLQK